MKRKFHLSVVATARNDNHGENFLYRMQHFIDGFIEQCKRHQLSAELIIVEWNPPDETEPLYKALKFPQDKGPCAIRFIRVPKEAHMSLAHSDKLPLFQMIAKNVGIRRALGEFVLATNIDILFSDKLICYLRDKLKTNSLVRADRLDVPSQLPETHSFDEILNFCDQNYFRINAKYGTKVKIDGKWRGGRCVVPRLPVKRLKKLNNMNPKELLKELARISSDTIQLIHLILKKVKHKALTTFLFKVHSNACGDFTLLSFEDWEKLQGYPELEMYSWHIDSVLLYQAKQASIKEVDLPRKMAIYHIEHGLGSGYTHEAANALFKRLRDRGIPHLNDSDLQKIAYQARKSKVPLSFNTKKWGMSDLSLEEVSI